MLDEKQKYFKILLRQHESNGCLKRQSCIFFKMRILKEKLKSKHLVFHMIIKLHMEITVSNFQKVKEGMIELKGTIIITVSRPTTNYNPVPGVY